MQSIRALGPILLSRGESSEAVAAAMESNLKERGSIKLSHALGFLAQTVASIALGMMYGIHFFLLTATALFGLAVTLTPESGTRFEYLNPPQVQQT